MALTGLRDEPTTVANTVVNVQPETPGTATIEDIFALQGEDTLVLA